MTSPPDFHDLHDITNLSDEQIASLLSTSWQVSWQQAQRRALRKMLDFPPPHGHYLHNCEHENCDYLSRIDHNQWKPDFPIRIEKIGGGASPEGYAAFVWPDELHVVALMSNDHDDGPVEDFSEEVCLWRALTALISNTTHRLGEPFLLDFPPKGKYTEQLELSVVMYQGGFGGKFARIAWEHDIDDVCLAITNGGLLS